MAELFLDRNEAIVSTRGLRSRPSTLEARHEGPFKDLPLIVLVNEYSASASEIVAGAIQDHGRGLIVGDRTYGKFSVQNLIPLVRSDAHLKLTTAHYYLPSGRSLHRTDDSTEWGVEPDVKVALVPKELRKVIEIRREADVLGPRGEADSDPDTSDRDTSDRDTSEPGETPVDKGTAKPQDPAAQGEPNAASESDDAPRSIESTDVPATQPADAEEEEPEPDPNNRPAVDPQLETALLLMRIRLVTEEFPAIAQYTREAITPKGESITGSPEPVGVKE
jgi:carboxyl-terminal processing protease